MASRTNDQIHRAVGDHYRDIARSSPGRVSCCGTECGESTNLLYPDQDWNNLPAGVTDLSLGCGDPVTLAGLKPGQVVLDLGSGGGIDCFLAAERVGAEGRVIGVDMTLAMIERAEENKERLGADNVEFRLGQIEALPISDQSIDVILSNCVINLSPDKPAVFKEAFRVLKPGGKLAVSDIVSGGVLPDFIKDSLSSWAACLAGAWDMARYTKALQEAGFVNLQINKQRWGEDSIDAAINSLDPGLREKIEENKQNNTRSLVIQDGEGMKVYSTRENSLGLDVEIFSARITAYKPI